MRAWRSATQYLRFLTVIAVAVTAGSASLSVVAKASVPTGPTVDRGTVEIETTAGVALNSGGSSTPFTLNLPKGAACPGDTAHDGFNVDTYAEPLGVKLGSVFFRGGFPDPGDSLIDTYGDPWEAKVTAVGTGEVESLPAFNWVRYIKYRSDLPAGTYNVGVVCADETGHATSYWNTEIQIVNDSSAPGGFIWLVVSGFRGHSSHGDGTAGIVLFAIAGAVIALGLGTAWRRSRSPRQATTGHRTGRSQATPSARR